VTSSVLFVFVDGGWLGKGPDEILSANTKYLKAVFVAVAGGRLGMALILIFGEEMTVNTIYIHL
jgi:hypothetical protein